MEISVKEGNGNFLRHAQGTPYDAAYTTSASASNATSADYADKPATRDDQAL